MTWRLIQKPTQKQIKGLAIGWGVPTDLDAAIRKALPGWAVMATHRAPRSVTFADYGHVRKLTQVPRVAPVIVFGIGEGALTVRTVLVSQCFEVWGVAAIGLPAPEAPLDEAGGWKVNTWKDAARRASTPQGGPLLITAPAAARASLGPALGLKDGELGLDAGGVLAAFCPEGDPRLTAGGIALLARFAQGPKR